MDSKVELYDKLLCMACLCVGQVLQQITDKKLLQYYMNTLHEIPMTPPNLNPSMCCDCTDALKKAVSFKEQIQDSYKTLLTYPHENLQEYLLEARNTEQSEVHVNQVYIKEEMKEELMLEVDVGPATHELNFAEDKLKFDDYPSEGPSDARSYGASDLSADSDMNAEVDALRVDVKKVKKFKIIKKKPKKRLNPSPNKKIQTIELSYEEMLQEREREAKKASYINAAYRCESCVIGFNYKRSYKAHVLSKHLPKLGEYCCPVCKTIVATVESFTAHYKRHMKRYECRQCAKRTMDMKVMQQHCYTAHEIVLKEYKCKICGKTSKSIHAHRYHSDSHKSRVKCPDCDKTFSHRSGLMNHRVAVHEYNNEFPCPTCGKEFKWKGSLRRHVQLLHRTPEQPSQLSYECTPCDITFASLSSYQRHMRNSLKHVSQDDLKFICDHCERRFVDKTKLRDHIEEKHLHKTYSCHICNKPSKNRVGLDQHIRNVHKGRPNNKMCHHCGKGFPTKVQLESHIRTHTGERPFICEFCPTTFSQQSNLYKHNRQVHMNIKSKRAAKRREEALPPEALPIHIEIHQEPMGEPTLQYTHTGFVL